MSEITTKPKPVAKTPATRQFDIPTMVSVVDRTSDLSDEVLTSLEASERAAIDAVGHFVVTLEEAVAQQVASTSDVAKTITESGLEMADRLVQTSHSFVRGVIESAAKSLGALNGAHPQAA
jgi:hypothetical protein